VSRPDAWIFLSIGDAGGASGWGDLDRVIGAADSNNHAIPTVGELEDAVRRLAGAGLVEADGTRLRLTDAGRSRYEAENQPGLGHIQRMLELSERWDVGEQPRGPEIAWHLDEEEWRAAWLRYRRWFDEAYARLRAAEKPGRERARETTVQYLRCRLRAGIKRALSMADARGRDRRS